MNKNIYGHLWAIRGHSCWKIQTRNEVRCPQGLKSMTMHWRPSQSVLFGTQKTLKAQKYASLRLRKASGYIKLHVSASWFSVISVILCDTKRTSRRFFLSTDSTEFRHVLQVATLLLLTWPATKTIMKSSEQTNVFTPSLLNSFTPYTKRYTLNRLFSPRILTDWHG